MTEHTHAVVIAGAGPTGLMLAGELALAGVDVAIVEQRATQELIGVRAGGLHARTLELLEQRGIVERFLAAGQVSPRAGFAWFPLDISDLPTRHPHTLALQQNDIERLLAGWLDDLAVPIYRGRTVTGFTQDDDGVTVMLSDDATLRASYLVGCDGGRSLVRKAAGIAFPGWDASISNLIAEVAVTEEPQLGLRRDASGIHGLSWIDGGLLRVMVTESQSGASSEPTLQDLSAALTRVYGTDFGVHSPRSLARFTDMARQAATYRTGRVLLAGDAAHVHYPTGGQGLNLGMQDAVNLGWKLAQVVQGRSPDSLLDTYHAERHSVAATVLRNTMAQSALLRTDAQTTALREIMSDLVGMDAPRQRLAAMITGLDVHYDLGLGEGHPLLGRRMPDLDLVTANGPLRVSTLLHAARPVLLNLGEPRSTIPTAWADRVQVVDAVSTGPWELPVIGVVVAPTAVLLRPDGHVAWVGDTTQQGLIAALTTWFGAPA